MKYRQDPVMCCYCYMAGWIYHLAMYEACDRRQVETSIYYMQHGTCPTHAGNIDKPCHFLVYCGPSRQ